MNLPPLRAEAIDSAMTKVGITATQGGSATTLVGWLLSNEGVAAVGIMTAVIGLAVQFAFSIRRDRRERMEQQNEVADRAARRKLDEELHAARIARLRAGLPEECE